MSIALVVAIALALDYFLKEPQHYHPLVGFGQLADKLERKFNQKSERKLKGIAAWGIAVVPLVFMGWWLETALQESPKLQGIVAAVIVYFSIGWQSLLEHARAVFKPLLSDDLGAARLAVSKIVSRDVDQLDEQGVAKAAIESVLENGADAILAAIFWFCLFGIPGVILYRLSNTLDAMWGYKNDRYVEYGWAAARIDDVLNVIPACLTALSYAIVGDTRSAFEHWKRQSMRWKSFSAGSVMSAGAGAIKATLGGDDIYHGKLQKRPLLGPEEDHAEFKPTADKLNTACELVNGSLVVWFLAIVIVETLL